MTSWIDGAYQLLNPDMSTPERWLVIASLINAAIFYTFTIIVFMLTRKTRLNKALATQKAFWLCIIAFVALPSYIYGQAYVPSILRVTSWLGLSVATWWVFYEVYRNQWNGSFTSWLRYLWCRFRQRCPMV